MLSLVATLGRPSGSRYVAQAFVEALRSGDKAVIATIVNTLGSTYRKAGASILVRSDGSYVGLLSGGCLEQEIVDECLALESQRKLLHFDLTPDSDYLLGSGKGCSGQMWILLEKISLGLMEHQLNSIHPQANALIIETGNRLILHDHGAVETDLKDQSSFIQQIQMALEAGKEARKPIFGQLQDASGSYSWCGWYAKPAIDLLIFGAGIDAIALCNLAVALGWKVRVCDHRPALLRHERFPLNVSLNFIERDQPFSQEIHSNTHAVIMSHDLLIDSKALAYVGQKNQIKYIGLLGPHSRKNRILKFIEEEYGVHSNVFNHRLYAPIGLHLGGDTETDIALAITAEIQKVWHTK